MPDVNARGTLDELLGHWGVSIPDARSTALFNPTSTAEEGSYLFDARRIVLLADALIAEGSDPDEQDDDDTYADGTPVAGIEPCTCEECRISRGEIERPYWDDDDPDEDDYRSDDGDGGGETEDSDPRARPIPIRADAPSLYLPAISGRERIRLMSFEQELGYGSNRGEVARRLYAEGFSPSSDTYGYGSSREVEHDSDTFVHVESDSSCGGEVIYSKMDLHNEEMAARAEDAISIVRDAIRDGSAKFGFVAGFHIHIGIQGYPMRAVENLYHAHNHLEDFLFRIGSANWSSHRDEVTGNDYSPKTRKGLQGTAAIGQAMVRARYSLNLSNYLSSRGSCHCGAFEFASWESCTCDLPKPTVEFRWPNATANYRKIHAYASLLQSLVATCESAPAGKFADLPAMEFTRTQDHRPDEWNTRAAWLGDNLPMTSEEWSSVAYCVRKARASFGRYAEGLASKVEDLPAATYELRSIERVV